MLVLATQFPLEAVDQALDAGLKNVSGHADRSLAFCTVGKNRQDSDQGTGAAILSVARAAVQQAHVKFFEMQFGKLGIVLLENYAHGVVQSMNRAVAADGHQFFIAEDLDSHRRFGGRAERFGA